MKRYALLACGLLVSACTTTSEAPVEQKEFRRVDCQIITDKPKLLAHAEQAKAICLPSAAAAASAAFAGNPGISAQIQIMDSTMISCMAEQGYLLRTVAEDEQECEAIRSRKRMTPRPRRSRPAAANRTNLRG